MNKVCKCDAVSFNEHGICYICGLPFGDNIILVKVESLIPENKLKVK